MSRRVNAKREIIQPGFQWVRQVEIEWAKVEAIRAHLRAGGKVPPAVVAVYARALLPLDGHHRTIAHDQEGLPLDAYTVPGRTFDRLDSRMGSRAEELIFCDGVPCMEVALRWHSDAKS
jgi:hypothetical protein